MAGQNDSIPLDKVDWSQFGEPIKPSSTLRRAGDMGLKLAQGVVGVPEAMVGLADLATGGRAGKMAEDAGVRFKDAKGIIGGYLSPEQKAADAAVQQAQGFIPTAVEMVKNPSTILGAAVESAPSMVAGGLASRGLLAVAPRIGGVAAGAIGEGVTAAGQNAEQVRQQDPNGLLSAKQSALLAGSGLLTGGIGFGAGKLANKLGIGDVNTMLATGRLGAVGEEAAQTAATKGTLRKIGEGALTEGVLQELPQSYQEQIAQNLAQGKPWDEGAGAAAAQGMLAGGLMGAGGAGLSSFGERRASAAQPAPGQDQTQPQAQTPASDPGVQAQPLLLGNQPDAMISFPDGTVARKSEVDQYIAGLPPETQMQARAKLFGINPQSEQATGYTPEPPASEVVGPAQKMGVPLLGVNDNPTGRFIVDENGNTRPETGVDASRTAQILREQQQEQERLRDIGLTSDVQQAQARNMARQQFGQTQVRPSIAMGINPSAGPLSSAAAIAVDGGAHVQTTGLSATGFGLRGFGGEFTPVTPVEQRQGIGMTARIGGPDYIDVAARELSDQNLLGAGGNEPRGRAARAPSGGTGGGGTGARKPVVGLLPNQSAQGSRFDPQAPQLPGSLQSAPQVPVQTQGQAAPAQTPAKVASPPGQVVSTAAPVELPSTTATKPRPATWRTNIRAAASVARGMGVEVKGRKLGDIVADIDRADSSASTPTSPLSGAQGKGTVQEVPVPKLALSSDVPQFKSDAGAGGVTQGAKLEGKYDRRLASPIQVWERKDGRMEVISGRHRLDLAQRSGEATIPAQIHREADGFTQHAARVLDIELNVKDGRGKVKDYVSYFKELAPTTQQARDEGLLNTALGRAAHEIADSGGETLVAAHRNGSISDDAAVAIAKNAPKNEALQNLGITHVTGGKSINFAVNVMRAARAAGFGEKASQDGDLFGFDDSHAKEAESIAKEASSQQSAVREQLRAITGASKRPELAAKGGVKVADVAATQSKIKALNDRLHALEGFATNPEVYRQLREDAGLVERQQAKPEPGPPKADTNPKKQPQAPILAAERWNSLTIGAREESALKAGFPRAAARDIADSRWDKLQKHKDWLRANDSIKARLVEQLGGDKAAPVQNSEPELLSSPTRDEVVGRQEAAAQAAAKTAKDQAAADRAAAQERERKDIADRSAAAADTFELGGDAMANLTGQQDIFGSQDESAAKPAKQPNAAKLRAEADLMNALADLGDIFNKPFKANLTDEQTQKLMPVMTRLLDAAFRLGYIKFKDAAKFALDKIQAAYGSDVADAITLDHLQGAYIGMAGGKVGADTKRAVIDVEDRAEISAHTLTEPAEDEALESQATPTTVPDQTLTQSLAAAIEAGNMPKDNPALKKLVESFDGQPADQARMKQAQEELETAIAMTARKVVAKNEGDRSTFDALLRMYESQPNLNVRTSTSIANQAYSTPAPLAFLASRLAGITSATVAHEPAAGTGMLLIGADPKKAIVNELNDLRIGALEAQGFKPTQKDAATQQLVPAGAQVDAVITNPPFGSVKDDAGKPTKIKVDGFNIGQIDHLIAARALEAMKQDGKATLILGANKATGGISTDDRIFFNWLYANYNVTRHFEVNGDLWNRQGAGWPVRVISINGRMKSGKFSPVAGTIQRADNWSEVYEQFTQSLKATNAPVSRTPDEPRKIPAPVVQAPTPTGASRPQGSTAGVGNVAGASPRAVPDRTKPAAEPVGASADEQRLNAQSYIPEPQPDAKPAASTRPAKPAGVAALDDAPKGNDFQLPYITRSSRKDEGVLIPANMAQPTQDALSRLEDEVGDIDEFARKELGYKTVDELHGALMGLQVDSVATAIWQIKRGKAVVIADQTGIGKGRQAASIIRWAAKQGMIPVFISVKPSLFTDMYGDLADIGTSDINPFILNGNAWVAGEDGTKLFANKPATHKAALREIMDSGELPGDSNALFMTYSQINVENMQRGVLRALAPNAVFVLDESHNAAGASATGQFMIETLGLAKGVAYLSATYAKRPDNMPLYFKTDIGDAAADAEGLSEAMAAGGLPLQTVVSNNLVKAGQMFRRERSYDGVSIVSKFDTPNRALHERMSNEATKALRAIVSADKSFHSIFVKNLSKELASEGSSIKDIAGNQASASVHHTEFSSVVHNFVKQMLLGLKAQTAADEAIASLKRGEKPVIAVENTMGSFLNEYAAANSIAQGDSLGSFDYRTVLSRALERTRVVVVTDERGNDEKRVIPLSELDFFTAKAYQDAADVIDGLKLSIPVSPIDWMRAEIVRTGFSVAEITGRNLSVDYSDPKKPVLAAIEQEEQKDKVNTTRLFNSGKLDALILNVAGSTGISLHASEKFEDQRQRHMIVAQAAGDINIFMQMIGRVHRTGQVRLPKYSILSVDLPTEKRPTAVLSVKMKSLNANTSSNTESATSVKTADILNKYGDQIVHQYLNDNYELARALGLEGEIGGEAAQDDIARKATGRLALQTIETQRTFYDDVEAQYDGLIEYLNKTNQNDLEPRTFDFDAKETRQEVLFEGPNKSTPFGEDAIYGEYSIKAQGHPMKPEEIRDAMTENLNGLTPEQHIIELAKPLKTKFDAYLKTLPEGVQQGTASQLLLNGQQFMQSHRIGSTFRVEINSEPFNAVVINIRNSHKETGNPFSLSKMQLTVAVNGALRSLTIPATQFNKIEVSTIEPFFKIEQLFKEQPANQRETAKIVTGNLLAAYGEIKGARGTIITFTKQDGTSEQGILLPKLFDYGQNTRGDYRLSTGKDALKFLQKSSDKDIGRFGIMSRDGNVRVLPAGNGVRVQVPKSKLKGGKFFLDKDLIAIGGDFVSMGSFMTQSVYEPSNAVKVLDALMKKQALYALPSMAEEAKNLTGDKEAAFSRGNLDAAPGITKPPTRAEIEATVRAMTSGWKNAPEVVVLDSMQDQRAPESARQDDARQRSLGAEGSVEGFVQGGTVYLVTDALSSQQRVAETLAHEVLGHYGLRGMFGDDLVPILGQIATMRRADMAAKALEYGLSSVTNPDATDAQILDGMTRAQKLTAADEILAEMAQTQPQIGFVRRAVAAIRTWLRRYIPAMRSLKLTDDEIVRSFILPARGWVERGRGGSVGAGGTLFSRSRASNPANPQPNTSTNQVVTSIKDFARNTGRRLQDFRGMALQGLGLSQLTEVYGDMLPMTTYQDLVQKMSAERNEIAAGADELATRWGNLDKTTKRPGENERLANLMHDATLGQIDPAKDFVDGDDRTKYNALRARWNALSPQAKEVYTKARNDYAKHYKDVRKAITERIERSALLAPAKAALLNRMDAEFFGRIKGVYFPLARFGDYLVVARDQNGDVASMSKAETLPEADALRESLLRDFPAARGYSVSKVLKSREFNATRDLAGRGFMKELFGELDKAGVSPDVLDSINQLYLTSLPDLSWAKHGIHRKGTAGFSQDARRAYAQNMLQGGRYLAKVRHADQLQTELDAMQQHVDDWKDADGFDPVKAQQVVDEMVKRHDTMMNPQTSKLSQALTSAGFLYHLGASPASAMVNLLQTGMVSYPVMGAKWGFDKAAAALGNASKLAIKSNNDIRTALQGNDLAAVERAVKEGVIDVTLAHDLSGIAAGEDTGAMWKLRPVMRYAGWMFHHAERFNRQITFLAAYRLARAEGANDEAAYKQAKDVVYGTHFDYSAANAPRIMQGNVARVVTQFKKFGQNMLYLMGKLAWQSLDKMPSEQRTEARRALAGLLATHTAAAGVLGLPAGLVAVPLAIASFLGGSDDEPWDAETAMKNYLAEALGQKLAEVLAHGLSRLTPFDISGRVGLNSLVLPDVQDGLSGGSWFDSHATALLGPSVGAMRNVWKGGTTMSEGKWQRGLEEMMPAALRGPMKSIRFATEGNVDKTGIVINEQLGIDGVLGQFFGLAPQEAALAAEGRRAIYREDKALSQRRSSLMRMYAMAVMAGDAEGAQELRDAVVKFNTANPTRSIKPAQLVQSVRARQRRINEADGGVYLPNGHQDAREAGVFAQAD